MVSGVALLSWNWAFVTENSVRSKVTRLQADLQTYATAGEDSAVELNPYPTRATDIYGGAGKGPQLASAIHSLIAGRSQSAVVSALLAPEGRKVIYTAGITLATPNIRQAHEAVRRIIGQSGGYLLNSTLDRITFRVPPENFDAALAELERIGKTIDREIASQDVTEEYIDNELRIEVAEASRKRLLALLEKTDVLKDILEVERDLRRLTEEIEKMKGRNRLLSNQAEMATVQVFLYENGASAPAPVAATLQFGWIGGIGIEHALRNVPDDAPLRGGRAPLRWFSGPRLRLAGNDRHVPEGFVKLTHTGEELLATTADGSRLRMSRIELRRRAPRSFWVKALRRDLTKRRGYRIVESEPLYADSEDLRNRGGAGFGMVKRAGMTLRCEINVGGEPWTYDIWLVQDARKLYRLTVIEFAHRAATDARHRADIESAVVTLGVS